MPAGAPLRGGANRHNSTHTTPLSVSIPAACFAADLNFFVWLLAINAACPQVSAQRFGMGRAVTTRCTKRIILYAPRLIAHSVSLPLLYCVECREVGTYYDIMRRIAMSEVMSVRTYPC